MKTLEQTFCEQRGDRWRVLHESDAKLKDVVSRVWVAEADWDALDPSERAQLETVERTTVVWEGRKGWVTAEVTTEVLSVLREAIRLHVGAAPPKPRTTKPKAPKSHRLTPHPDADPLAQHGMATVSYLDSEGWHSLGRQPGENASAWKGRYTAILGEVSAELHRVYDGARRCTYDSRDGAP